MRRVATVSLVATAAAETTTAACDYLAEKLGPADEVYVLAVEEPAVERLGPRRDAPGGFSTVGTTTRAVLSTVEVPVFVVPRDP